MFLFYNRILPIVSYHLNYAVPEQDKGKLHPMSGVIHIGIV